MKIFHTLLILFFLPLTLAGGDEKIEALKRRITDYEQLLIQPIKKELATLRARFTEVQAELDRIAADIEAVKEIQAKYRQALLEKKHKVELARSRLPELLLKRPVQLTKRDKYDPWLRRKWLDAKDWWRRKSYEWAQNGFGIIRAAVVKRGMSESTRKELMAAYKQALAERDRLNVTINQRLNETGIPLQSRSGQAIKVKGMKNIEVLIWELQQRQHELEIERASIKADIYAREHSLKSYLEELAKLKAELESLYAKKLAEQESARKRPPPRPEGGIDFLLDMQVPTPRGAFEIPVVLEVFGSYDPTTAVRYARINLRDPAAATYVTLFGKRPKETIESSMDRFTRLGEALTALRSEGHRNDFKSGAIRHVPAVVLYRIDMAGRPTRYWMTHPEARWNTTLGRFAIAGLAPGKHVVHIQAVTQSGERLEAKRTLLVRQFRKVAIAAARTELATMIRRCEQAFAIPDPKARIYALINGLQNLQRPIAAVAESAGCKPQDLYGALDVEARALAVLINANPFWKQGWASPRKAMEWFRSLCTFTCTEKAYRHLSSVAAAARAFAGSQGNEAYTRHADSLSKGMADISLALGKHSRTIADLMKVKVSRESWWPSPLQLKELFSALK
ncbi:MAG TPA: hypothetical protein ENN40_04095 [Candidatus Aminicenantes bacterium]|nr:hypothetical protein [Candidatus Aminicenantes bacterium]